MGPRAPKNSLKQSLRPSDLTDCSSLEKSPNALALIALENQGAVLDRAAAAQALLQIAEPFTQLALTEIQLLDDGDFFAGPPFLFETYYRLCRRSGAHGRVVASSTLVLAERTELFRESSEGVVEWSIGWSQPRLGPPVTVVLRHARAEERRKLGNPDWHRSGPLQAGTMGLPMLLCR